MTRPADYQETLARCYVAMAEVDYDLRAWRASVEEARPTDQGGNTL